MNAKEAVSTAVQYVTELIPQASEILLEEVEKTISKNKPCWMITLSMTIPGKRQSIAAIMAATGASRDYKVFSVDANSGEVISMKIRELK